VQLHWREAELFGDVAVFDAARLVDLQKKQITHH
jgi:hypothetical protein